MEGNMQPIGISKGTEMKLKAFAAGVALCVVGQALSVDVPAEIKCAGSYGGHLQGTDAFVTDHVSKVRKAYGRNAEKKGE
jgi:hypothetical protein